MLANWIKETTTTTGTGTITLAGAVTGFLAFTNRFTDGELVYYTIKDGDNREAGIGTFTASGTILARTTVLETLVSGTLDDTFPSAINLSGSAVVSVTPTSGSLQSATHYRPTLTQAGIIGENITNPGLGNTTKTANTIYLIPYKLSDILVSKLSFRIQTAGSGGEVAKIGVYANDPTTKTPGKLIYESPDMSVASAVIVSDSSMTPFWLHSGWWWVAFITDSSTAVPRGFKDQAGGNLGGVFTDVSARGCIEEAGISSWAGAGNLPATITPGNDLTFNNVPAILINAV